LLHPISNKNTFSKRGTVSAVPLLSVLDILADAVRDKNQGLMWERTERKKDAEKNEKGRGSYLYDRNDGISVGASKKGGGGRVPQGLYIPEAAF